MTTTVIFQNKSKKTIMNDDVEGFQNRFSKVHQKAARDKIIWNAILYGSTNIIQHMEGLGWFNDKWFGFQNITWFQVLFDYGIKNHDNCFQCLREMNKLTTENILCEIIHNKNVFQMGIQAAVDFMIDNIEKLDNDMLLMPYTVLLLNGHITLANRLGEHFEITGDECIPDNLLNSITSSEGLKIFLEMISATYNFVFICDIIYRILYKIMPNLNDQAIVDCLLKSAEHPAFIHFIINNVIDHSAIVPASLTLYGDFIFKSIRSYFHNGYYPNMPMENEIYLDKLVSCFHNHYRKITFNSTQSYYLLCDEQPFVEEDFNQVLNDFLDNHRIQEVGEHECQICMETISGDCPIMCCLSENFSNGHTFCESCISKWLKPDCRSCPVCRSEIL